MPAEPEPAPPMPAPPVPALPPMPVLPVCPRCLHDHGQSVALTATAGGEAGDGGLRGSLVCPAPWCRQEYPVIDGVPVLVPGVRDWVRTHQADILARRDLPPDLSSLLGDCLDPGAAWNNARLQLSIYAADHYGCGDEAGTGSAGQGGSSVHDLLAAGLQGLGDLPDGVVVDLGCAVGGTSFTLAERFADRHVLGLDLNWTLLRAAQEMWKTGALSYPLRETGLVHRQVTRRIAAEAARPAGFWIADALAPPLPPGSAALVVALNLIDCVQAPAALLQAIDTLLAPGGVCLLATPYDWSTAATPVEAWIGGHSQRGADAGRPEPRLRALLAGGAQALPGLGLRLEREGEHDWQLRLHARARMLYRCDMLRLRKGPVPDTGPVP